MQQQARVDYKEVLGGDDQSLKLFLEALAEFDRSFCERMFTGDDFNLRVEVHGCKGKLIHVRVSSDGFKRPPGRERLEGKKSGKVVF